MKSFAVLAAVAGLTYAAPQATSASASASPATSFSTILPSSSAPAGCKSSYNGQFQIEVVNVTSSKRSLEKRQSTALEITLANGVLTDSKGRIGYIASNDQFQFDYGTQAGAKITAGWSVCSNNTLALGGSAIFYECLSGTFYNLYDANDAAQCSPVYIDVVGGAQAGVTQAADGQATAGVASQLSDGQITATPNASPVSQITDGQIQASTGAAAPITQISDGQIQASTAAPKPTGAPVTQISDGQIQASTAATPVTQISDGQIQAPTNGTGVKTASPTSSPVAFTGAAALPSMRAELFGLAAGVLAIAAL